MTAYIGLAYRKKDPTSQGKVAACAAQMNHEHILEKHLKPRFGADELSALTAPALQAYIAELERRGYAPKTIAHIHDVLSAVLRTGVKWRYLSHHAREVG